MASTRSWLELKECVGHRGQSEEEEIKANYAVSLQLRLGTASNLVEADRETLAHLLHFSPPSTRERLARPISSR